MRNKLTAIIKNPSEILNYKQKQLDLFIRQARSARLLGHFWYLFADHKLIDKLPATIYPHLLTGKIQSAAHCRSVQWEVDCISRELSPCNFPIIFLKGAAYYLQALDFSRGRIFSDIDILVPQDKLECVEKALREQGWKSTKLTAYDEKYYRQWMHELPPMRHVKRRSVIDVHHTILPPTSKLHPNPSALIANSIAVQGNDKIHVLSPEDMVLHSATHLLHEGEFSHGLRDLVDLHSLFSAFADDQDFWTRLVSHTREQQLVYPLYYALEYCRLLFDSPIPAGFIEQFNDLRPNRLTRVVMRSLFIKAVEPDHPSCQSLSVGLARWLLFVRAHYLRMPLYLLIPHLLRKAFVQDKK